MREEAKRLISALIRGGGHRNKFLCSLTEVPLGLRFDDPGPGHSRGATSVIQPWNLFRGNGAADPSVLTARKRPGVTGADKTTLWVRNRFLRPPANTRGEPNIRAGRRY